MRRVLTKLLYGVNGQGLTEYGLVIFIVSVSAIAGLIIIGGGLNEYFELASSFFE